MLAALVAGRSFGATPQQLDDALGASPALARAMLREPRATPRSTPPPSSHAIEAFILARDPAGVPLPPTLSELWALQTPLSFKLQRLRQALTERPAPPALPELYRWVLKQALEQGLDSFALELWKQRPEAIELSASKDHELALELALASAPGEPALSKALVPDATIYAPPPPGDGLVNVDGPCFGDFDGCRIPVLEEALARSRDPKRAARDVSWFGAKIEACFLGPPLRLPLARLLRALPDKARRRLLVKPRESTPLPSRASVYVRPAEEELARARANEARLIAEELRKLPATKAYTAGHELILRLLEAPQPQAWTERAAPGNRITAEALEEPAPVPGAKELALPSGFDAVRIEARGVERWVVATSYRVDSTAMIESGQGYWLLHSTDVGRTWDRPLYTGLRQRAPYLIVPSEEPMVDHGKVRLAVLRSVGDGMWEYEPKIVESTLETLRRDSDGDGLSDLLEWSMLTDPHAADTDGDGLPDGVDPFPTIAFRKDASNDVALLLGELRSGSNKNVAPRLEDAFTLVIGDRFDFAPATATSRTQVVTREELEAIEAKRGALIWMELGVSPGNDPQHATCEIRSLGGETYSATKQGGRWTLVRTGVWYH